MEGPQVDWFDTSELRPLPSSEEPIAMKPDFYATDSCGLDRAYASSGFCLLG